LSFCTEKFQKNKISTWTPDMNDKLSPCDADALSQVRQIGTDGRKAGTIRPGESISEVMTLNLTGDSTIQAALLQRIAEHNYIPPSATDACAKSLMAEFYANRTETKDGRCAGKLLPGGPGATQNRGREDRPL
jgi:hypothetical protein